MINWTNITYTYIVNFNSYFYLKLKDIYKITNLTAYNLLKLGVEYQLQSHIRTCIHGQHGRQIAEGGLD